MRRMQFAHAKRAFTENTTMVLFLRSFLLISVVLAMHSAPAQQRAAPPPGWELVRNLDFVNSVNFHASGDTLFLNGLISTNSGATWDTLWVNTWDTIRHTLPFPDFFPHSAAMWAVTGIKGTKNGREFIVSRGTSEWTEYPFDSTTNASIGTTYDGAVNPFDDNDIFLLTDQAGQQIREVGVWRSRNGGRSWARMLNLPPPDQGIGAVYALRFDVRAAGQWYLGVQSGYMSQGESHYKTSDNGNTFERMNCWGTYAGISATGVFRTLWENPWNYPIGVIDYGPNGRDSTNWLWRMDSTLPLTNLDSGYAHLLSSASYVFYDDNPSHAFIAEAEGAWNPKDSMRESGRSQLYETTNDGEVWNSLWTTHSVPFVWDAYLDQRTNTIWASSFDSVGVNSFVGYPFHSLFRYRLNTAIGSETDRLVPRVIVIRSVYPNPIRSMARIEFTTNRSGHVTLGLFDMEGNKVRELFDGFSDAGVHQVTWNLPPSIRSGAYLLRLEARGIIKTTNMVIVK
jgi:hypothetical protein